MPTADRAACLAAADNRHANGTLAGEAGELPLPGA